MITATVKTVEPTTNTACITKTSVPDPDESNTCDDATLTPVAADLALTKSLTGFSGDPATNIITAPFKLAVTNNGPSDATGVMVEDPLPEGATLVSASAAYDVTTGIWTIGALKARRSVSSCRIYRQGTVGRSGAVGRRSGGAVAHRRTPGGSAASGRRHSRAAVSRVSGLGFR